MSRMHWAKSLERRIARLEAERERLLNPRMTTYTHPSGRRTMLLEIERKLLEARATMAGQPPSTKRYSDIRQLKSPERALKRKSRLKKR